MTRIRIKFVDMWKGFRPESYAILKQLQGRYQFEFSDDPEYLIFSVFGDEHLEYSDVKKIFMTHEAAYPDFRYCDYSLTFHPDAGTPRNLYVPNYLHRLGYEQIESLKDMHLTVGDDQYQNRDVFCSFLVSNGNAWARNKVFEELSEYKQVSSGGGYANNMGGNLPGNETMPFLQRCRFNISGENSKAPGYVTEKIVVAMLGGTIPIFWGDSFVNQLFNPARFLNVDEFESFDALKQRVIELDNDPREWLDVVRQPVFASNELPVALSKKTVVDFFDRVFSGGLDSSPKPSLSNRQLGRLKGTHRRAIIAPMDDEEDQVFRETRALWAKRGLL